MMLYENTDLKNTVFGEYGEEKFIKVIYQGYHREGLHQVRLKWYPEAVDNDDEIKLVHESLFMDYQTTEKPAELQSDPTLLKKKQKRHKPSLRQEESISQLNYVLANQVLLAGK